MLRILVIPSLVLISIAGSSAVQAAPLKLHAAPVAIDHWVDLLRPWELVGPPVDPNGPLTRGPALRLEPEPAPWRAVQVQAAGF